MIIETLQELGLARNEAKIYETLLREGECGVSKIASRAEINRRNVYDSLNRLIEKGLVFDIRTANENRYRAVEPGKLSELVAEKQKNLSAILPELGRLYYGTPHTEEVYVYRGIEGWKNYLRDILRVGEDTFTIGGKGSWNDPKLADFMKVFLRDAVKARVSFHILFDHGVMETEQEVIKFPGVKHKFLPKEYSTGAIVETFGDYVVTFSGISLGAFDEHSSITVVVNKEIANAYRTWFKLIWNLLPENKLSADS